MFEGKFAINFSLASNDVKFFTYITRRNNKTVNNWATLEFTYNNLRTKLILRRVQGHELIKCLETITIYTLNNNKKAFDSHLQGKFDQSTRTIFC